MTPGRRVVVLHVIEGLGTGGSESQLAAFLFRSDPTRFRHEVCTLAQVGRFAGDLEKAGIPVHALGLLPDGDLARALARLWRVVRRVNPDIIHSSLYRPTIVARVVGRLSRKRVITTLVNTAYEPEWVLDNPRLSPRKVWLVQMIDRLTAKWWGGSFVAITASVKDSAVRRIGLSPGEITVIPRGLDFDHGTGVGNGDVAAIAAQLGWTGAYPIILNVARLVPQKGQRYAIQAMHRVVARFPSARLYIAGEGPLRPALEQLIRSEGLQAHVTLLGERRDARVLLRAADVFVFPSLFEGLGNAVLEAMGEGRPCVVSRIPALREITGDGQVALLAELQSPKDIAASLVRVAADRALAERLGSAAQAWVRARYNIADSVAAQEAVYEKATMPRAQQRPSWVASALLATVRGLDLHRAGTLRVLVYHRVGDLAGARGDPQVFSATPASFDEQMQYIARHYAPITARQAVAALVGETAVPRRAVLVTFDDGYRDFLTNAWPVLKRHGVPALLFVPTAFPGAARAFWWDELYEMMTTTTVPRVQVFGLGPLPLGSPQERWVAVRQLNRFLKPRAPADLSACMQALREIFGTAMPPLDPVLTWDELRGLVAEGLAVGSHTRTHPALPALTETQLRGELLGAHADLERELGGAVPVFSYPYGITDARAVPTLRELGYAAACISLLGRNAVGQRDPFLLYRHSVDIQDSLTSLAMSLTSTYVGVRESGRAAKARVQHSLSRWVPSR